MHKLQTTLVNAALDCILTGPQCMKIVLNEAPHILEEAVFGTQEVYPEQQGGA